MPGRTIRKNNTPRIRYGDRQPPRLPILMCEKSTDRARNFSKKSHLRLWFTRPVHQPHAPQPRGSLQDLMRFTLHDTASCVEHHHDRASRYRQRCNDHCHEDTSAIFIDDEHFHTQPEALIAFNMPWLRTSRMRIGDDTHVPSPFTLRCPTGIELTKSSNSLRHKRESHTYAQRQQPN